MKFQTYIRAIASLMIALVLSMPLYSAQSLAAMSVTKNVGTDNIDGYLDAAGDTWTLKVLASLGSETITASQVRVNGYPSDGCVSVGALGTECTSSITFGSRDEGLRTIPIALENAQRQVVERTETQIILDGTAPRITASGVQGDGNTAEVTFTVTESPALCVGLQKVQVKHGSNVVTLEDDELEAIKTGTCGSSQIKSVEGQQTVIISSSSAAQAVEVIATDRLGHERKKIVNFPFDAVAPVIKDDTLFHRGLTEFVPSGSTTTDVTLEIEEDSATLDATLSGGGLTDADGSCSITGTRGTKKVFTCAWNGITINFEQSLALTVMATDGHHTATRTITKTFNVDSAEPRLIRFGTQFGFNDLNFVSLRDNVFIAEFAESGSGISKQNVKADFSELSSRYRGDARVADECTSSDGVTTCVWNTIHADSVGSGQTKTATIVSAKDNVGNQADLIGSTVSVQRDDTAPVISNAQAVVDGETRSFFQSGDQVSVRFDVTEANGVTAFIDTHEVIVDSDKAAAECVEDADDDALYHCTAVTDAIGQFDGNTVTIPLLVYDAAGNKGVSSLGRQPALSFTVFGTDADLVNPNFWTLTSVELSPEALDAHLTSLTKQRLFATLKLRAPVGIDLLQVKVVSCDVAEGTPDEVVIADSSMINNFAGSKNPTIVVEFEPFDARGTEPENAIEKVDLKCTISIQSGRGTRAIQQVETEEVDFAARFYLTPYDDALSNLEEEIDDAKDHASRGLFKVIGTLNEIFTWVKIICSFISLFYSITTFFAVFNAGMDPVRDVTPAGTALAIASCEGTTAQEVAFGGFVDTLKIICAVSSCTGQFRTGYDAKKGGATALGEKSFEGDSAIEPVLKWYFGWQKDVLNFYNSYQILDLGSAVGEEPIGLGAVLPGSVKQHAASSLYDNIVLSTIGLCLPGIIYNVEKYRQIECRYVSCLENEVQAGVATIESCRELKDYQQCKYVAGELFQLLPFVNAFDNLVQSLKTFIQDPVGIVRVLVLSACAKAFCATSGSITSTCKAIGYIVYLLDFVNNIVSTFQQIQTTTEKDYCEQVGL